MKQRFFYGCIGYESGLLLAIVIQLLTGLPFSLLNSLGLFGVTASLAIAEYKGKAPTLAQVYRPVSLTGFGRCERTITLGLSQHEGSAY